MRLRSRDADRFEVADVAERLAPYNVSYLPAVPEPEDVDDDLVEKAVTLLLVMPRNQPRETLEGLVSRNDPERGRRAVDALIDAALAAEDTTGRLRRIASRLDVEFTAGRMTATTRRRIATRARRPGFRACTTRTCVAPLGRGRPRLRVNSTSSL